MLNARINRRPEARPKDKTTTAILRHTAMYTVPIRCRIVLIFLDDEMIPYILYSRTVCGIQLFCVVAHTGCHGPEQNICYIVWFVLF